jgi:hypothetical protein
MNNKLNIESYNEFYLYYLSQHVHPTCRTLHTIGTSLGLLCLIGFFVTGKWWLIIIGLTLGYGFAWTGHFFFEKNKPAAFSKPWWSFVSDWVMLKDVLTGEINNKLKTAESKFSNYISDEAKAAAQKIA